MSENQHESPAVAPIDQTVEMSLAPEAAPAAPPKQKEKTIMVGQTMSAPTTLKASSPEDWSDLIEGPVDNPNVKLTMEYTTAPISLRDRKDLNGSTEVMFFLAERGKNVDDRIRANVSPVALRTGKGRDWNESIVAAAARGSYLDRRLEESTKREGAQFLQYLATESSKLGFTAPQIAEAGASSYTGERAVMRVRSLMGLGGLVSVPLWHSGFWVTLTAPSESRLIELQRRLQDEKIELGRETFGLVFSNEQSYLNSFLLDFCMEHIYDHSVRVDQNADLRPLMKIQDLNILFWGLACLVWPRGFDYVRSLTTKEGIENTETISAKINVGKLMWVDNNSFDDKLKMHMTHRKRGAMTVDSILEYQKNFVPSLSQGRRVVIKEGLEVLISSTDVDNFIADGERWIAGIVQTVDSTFTQAIPSEEERNRMITMHARASRLRNYGAWVKAIIIEGSENTERDTITQLLDVLSVDEETTVLIESAITKFIDDSTRALIAIPETSGKEVGLPRFPHLIPVDVLNTFFTLLAQRVDIISRR